MVDLASFTWESAAAGTISQYWSGEPAPVERHSRVRAQWTNQALYLRFDCQQHEQLVASTEPTLDRKTIGLWGRDVCEAFIKPESGAGGREPGQVDSYFEFEAAPTGEWLDLLITPAPEGRITDWEYRSGMTVASRVEPNRVIVVMRIPWEAFGIRPQAGDRWRANFFRCVGEGDTRGYLAWCPTLTLKPDFHVPERFGELVFGE